MGEYPEEYEDGAFVAAPTWLAGLADAKAGIVMPAKPRVGGPSYSQGWGPAVEFTDRARVFETGSRTCVPAGCYDDVVVTDEFNPDEPDSHQLKYHGPSVGVVRVGWAGALDEAQETLELLHRAPRCTAMAGSFQGAGPRAACVRDRQGRMPRRIR
jgi:hypothetical protein